MLCKRRPSEVYIYQIKRVGNRIIEPGLLLYNYFGVFSGSLIKMKKLGRRRLRVSRGRTKMRNRSHSEILKLPRNNSSGIWPILAFSNRTFLAQLISH